MSSITQLQQELLDNRLNLSAEVLFLFDCVITLSQEVEVIWQRRWTATTWLYALTRYCGVLNEVILLCPIWNFMSCTVIMRADQVVELIQFLCLAWFSALRVYALLDGKYLLPGVVLLLNLVPFATNMVNIIASTVFTDFETCTSIPGISQDCLLLLTLITRILVIIADLLVLAVTWTKTAQSYHEARRLNIRAPLATILFRDGTSYFIILLVVNVLQVIEENIPICYTINIVEPFFNIIPSMIVCRFILGLRQIEPAGSSWIPGNHSHSLRFVGNMGQSLQFGVVDEPDRIEDAIEMKDASAGANVPPEFATSAEDIGQDRLRLEGHVNFDNELEV